MLFGLQSDSGDVIVFYLAPDSHAEIPWVRIVCNANTLVEFAANEYREALVSAKRHESGLCGFRIDETMIPGLADLADLEIYERDSGVLVYRRRPPEAVSKKILRIETRLIPMLSFERSVRPYFQYYSKQIENYGLESATQMFLLSQPASIYLSGRINFINYSHWVDSVFDTVIFLDDPYVTLAERLLVLSKLHAGGQLRVLSERDAVLLEPAAAFACEIDLNDGRSLRRALKNLPLEVGVALANPVARQLTVAAPNEMLRRGALGAALDTMASFALVGIQGDEVGFRDTFARLADLDPARIEINGVPAAVARLARLLHAEADVEELMEVDLELVAAARRAHQAATTGRRGSEEGLRG